MALLADKGVVGALVIEALATSTLILALRANVVARLDKPGDIKGKFVVLASEPLESPWKTWKALSFGSSPKDTPVGHVI